LSLNGEFPGNLIDSIEVLGTLCPESNCLNETVTDAKALYKNTQQRQST